MTWQYRRAGFCNAGCCNKEHGRRRIPGRVVSAHQASGAGMGGRRAISKGGFGWTARFLRPMHHSGSWETGPPVPNRLRRLARSRLELGA